MNAPVGDKKTLQGAHRKEWALDKIVSPIDEVTPTSKDEAAIDMEKRDKGKTKHRKWSKFVMLSHENCPLHLEIGHFFSNDMLAKMKQDKEELKQAR